MKTISKIFLFFVLTTVLCLATQLDAEAQCAMCRATAENSSDMDSSVASGLNAGILYLLVMPYLLVGVIGFLWYRKYKKHDKNKISNAGIA